MSQIKGNFVPSLPFDLYCLVRSKHLAVSQLKVVRTHEIFTFFKRILLILFEAILSDMVPKPAISVRFDLLVLIGLFPVLFNLLSAQLVSHVIFKELSKLAQPPII